MKKFYTIFTLIFFAGLFTACTGGTFVDPGHLDGMVTSGNTSGFGGSDGGGGGKKDGGGAKPTELPSSASYTDALAKLDAIIAYSGTTATQKTTAEGIKTAITAATSFAWSSTKAAQISAINILIGQLS